MTFLISTEIKKKYIGKCLVSTEIKKKTKRENILMKNGFLMVIFCVKNNWVCSDNLNDRQDPPPFKSGVKHLFAPTYIW